MLTFILVICVVVGFHEFGHFLLAKTFGVGVTVFSIGFGPKLLSKKVGETEYCLSLVPLGGYIKMVGEVALTTEEKDPKSYNSKPRWQRIIILLAGPVFNFILGFLLIVSAYIIFGIPTLSNKISAVQENSPAAQAGLQVNDKVVAVNEVTTKTFEEVRQEIASANPKKELRFKIERGNSYLIYELKPVLVSGKPLVGITGQEVVPVKNPKNSISAGWNSSVLGVKAISNGLKQLVTGEIKAKDSLGGPIAIASAVSTEKSQNGWNGIFMFVAFISFNLGIVNLFPIPILDGGGITILLIESIARRDMSSKVKNGLIYIGLAFLFSLMAYTMYNDISHLLSK